MDEAGVLRRGHRDELARATCSTRMRRGLPAPPAADDRGGHASSSVSSPLKKVSVAESVRGEAVVSGEPDGSGEGQESGVTSECHGWSQQSPPVTGPQTEIGAFRSTASRPLPPTLTAPQHQALSTRGASTLGHRMVKLALIAQTSPPCLLSPPPQRYGSTLHHFVGCANRNSPLHVWLTLGTDAIRS